MAKLIGYILALAGLAIAVLSFNLTRLNIVLPASIKQVYVLIAGIALIIAGVVLSLESKKKQSSEVPIYEGVGKKRVIVGYQKVHR